MPLSLALLSRQLSALAGGLHPQVGTLGAGNPAPTHRPSSPSKNEAPFFLACGGAGEGPGGMGAASYRPSLAQPAPGQEEPALMGHIWGELTPISRGDEQASGWHL